MDVFACGFAVRLGGAQNPGHGQSQPCPSLCPGRDGILYFPAPRGLDMAVRTLLAVAIVFVLAGSTFSQAPVVPLGRRPAGSAAPTPAMLTPIPGPTIHAAGNLRGSGTLPQPARQVWRESTSSTPRAERRTAVVDWILRETGYEVWHSEPLGILSRSPREHSHIPYAADAGGGGRVVPDRFVAAKAKARLGLRVMTLEGRLATHKACAPVASPSPPAQALALAGAKMPRCCMAETPARLDYRDTARRTSWSMLRPRAYVRDVTLRPSHCLRLWHTIRPDRRGLLPGVQPADELGTGG